MNFFNKFLLSATVSILLLPPVFSADTSGTDNPKSDAFRLPKSIVPSSYTINFDPDLDKGTFKGSESIDLEISQTVNRIYLNSLDLTIENAELRSLTEKGKDLPGATVTTTKGAAVATLILAAPVEAGKYRLNLKFSGKMNQKLCGFYKIVARDESGRTVNIGATQMEPTDARRMFPCFDEPDFKATFKLAVSVDEGNVAISNSAVAKEDKRKGVKRRIVEFAPTPKMSTYLVTLLVGPFASTPPATTNSVPIRVWAVKGSENMGVYARDQAAKLLPFFTNYFAQPYPGRKLDLIALPEFEAGAMENLGAITFREEMLLLDKKRKSVEEERRISSVVAHEMAHLWFGDLVTMKWWDDLWLNEAFATWMSVKAVDFIRPDWRSWEDFTYSRLHAMRIDELISTRPIHAEVKNPLEAIEMFDGITYSKGASILRMLEIYLGEKIFQNGVQKYMKEHQFSNATTTDLWNSLQSASSKPVADIMHSWVHEPGYPVVEVIRKDGASAVRLNQTRFIVDAVARAKASSAKTTWPVPVTWRAISESKKDEPQYNFLLSGKSAPLVDLSPKDALLLNSQASGYYRSNYPAAELQKILKDGLGKLSVSERIALLSDQWTLSFAGMSPLSNYFELLKKYDDQFDPLIIDELTGGLESLYGLTSQKDRPNVERFIRERLSKIADNYGWKNKSSDTDLTRNARAQVVRVMGTLGQDQETIVEARKLYSAYLSDAKQVDPDMINAVFDIVAYNGDEATYLKILQLWRIAKSPEDRVRSLQAMRQFRKPDLIEKTLKFALGTEIRLQDAPHLMEGVILNTNSKNIAFKFVKDNWLAIKKRLPAPAIPHVVSSFESMCTPEEEKELRQFLAVNPIAGGRKRILQAVERVHNRVAFRNRSGSELEQLLSKAAD